MDFGLRIFRLTASRSYGNYKQYLCRNMKQNNMSMSMSKLYPSRPIQRKHSDGKSNSVKSISYATIRPIIDTKRKRKSDRNICLVSTTVNQILYFVAFADCKRTLHLLNFGSLLFFYLKIYKPYINMAIWNVSRFQVNQVYHLGDYQVVGTINHTGSLLIK